MLLPHHGPLARLLARFALLLCGICCATLVAGTCLVHDALRNAQAETFTARFHLLAQRAAEAAERAAGLGVPLAPDTPLAALLTREAATEPALRAFKVTSARGEVLVAAAVREVGAVSVAPRVVRMPIRDDLGQIIAWAQVRYDDAALRLSQQHTERGLWKAMAGALLVVAAGLAGMLAVLRRRQVGAPARDAVLGSQRNRLLISAVALLAVALLWLGWRATVIGQQAIAPDQRAKAEAVARSSAALVGRALDAGIPLERLVGVTAHAEAVRSHSPEIATLGVVALEGGLLAGALPDREAGAIHVPVYRQEDASAAAQVVLGVDSHILARRLHMLLLDMAFLGIICLLLSLEWVALGLGTRGARALTALEARRASGRARGAWRASGAAAVRPALFLFMFSEELTRSFLPTWARTLAPVQADLSAEWLAGLPLVIFLAVVALLQWPLAAWSEQIGRRRGMLHGALLGAVGMALAAIVPQFHVLLGARLVGAVGFALVFVSAQGAVIDVSTTADRARSLGQFVRAILVAGLCGPPLGGMVAEHWGPAAGFGLAAFVALLAGLTALAQMPAPRGVSQALPGVRPELPRAAGRAGQPGLWALLLGCALPAKLLLAALCFYLLPLHLHDLGYGASVTGRLQMIYPLAMVLLVPVFARQADQGQRRTWFVLVGGLVAGGSALLAWPAGNAPWGLALVLLGVGVGQALSITPQSAMVADLARSAPPRVGARVLGVFRLTERGGSALGPLVGAWLLAALGFGGAVAAIGVATLAGSAAYGLALRRQRKRVVST